ncbi:unnamed protein product [Fusarium graminearum]|nr:unnamed protein product [Fusarium graminearum]
MSAKLHTVPFLINGSDHVSETTADVVSPVNGEVTHRYSSADVKDANSAVAEIMERRQEELRGYAMTECGSDAAWASFDVNTGISHIKEIAGRVGTIEGSIPTVADPNTTALVLREPYGVVVAIAPWNAPYILGTRSVLFPIAAGNTVVFKASETCPRTFWAIGDIFREAGFPDGVLNVIYHERANAASVTTALIEHPQVKKINFTVGRLIGKIAGENLKPVILELGGKAPAIVWEDADLDLAALQCTLGAFINSGQVCMSTERILVFSSAADAPILVASAPVEKNKALIKDAIAKGASLAHGDVDAKEVSNTRMRPIVVRDVTAEMDIYKTESFGPTTEEEAIKIANDTEYGLSSAVFTSDLQRGLRIAREIESGAVHINNMSVHDESGLPHGGAKSSGYGRFGTSAGLEEWTRTKNITLQQSCQKKCVPNDYREGELNKGESVCLDRCTAKFLDTSMKVSEIMQQQGQALGGQQGGGGMF